MTKIPMSTWIVMGTLLVSLTAAFVTMQTQIGYIQNEMSELKAELRLFDNVHEVSGNQHQVLRDRVLRLEVHTVTIRREVNTVW